MHWDVKVVRPSENFRIYVEVENGSKGYFDMKPYLDRGIFKELKNEAYFRTVGIVGPRRSRTADQCIGGLHLAQRAGHRPGNTVGGTADGLNRTAEAPPTAMTATTRRWLAAWRSTALSEKTRIATNTARVHVSMCLWIQVLIQFRNSRISARWISPDHNTHPSSAVW
jgi:hypothetical protein